MPRWTHSQARTGIAAMDNAAVARQLAETADLLEIKGENPFKIRAYRNAAETVATAPDAVAALSEAALQQLPGIGRDLARRIRETVETGDTEFRKALLAEFPPTILDLLHLQGVGPKTVKQLYAELGIRTVDDLEAAARDGRLTRLRGMGAKKQALILKAVDERRRHAGRHLLPDAHDAAAAIVAHLAEEAAETELLPVGSLRRGCETCGDIDILAIGGAPPLMDRFTSYRLVERVLGRGETKASVLLRGGFQADLRLVARESRGAAMQYFTGSKAHNIALRDRALGRGWKLNEYGLFDADGGRLAGDDEPGIYAALGLAWVPPELREARGEIEAATEQRLPRLVERADLRGDVHVHTNVTDGRDDIETMARAAREQGLEYIAITDHSQALAMANGLDERRALAHARAIREVNDRIDGIELLAGIECDIRADGTLDLADDCLAQLDYVVASVHSSFGLEEQAMTDRVLRALECPWVDTLGHPTGRILLRREPVRLRLDAVFAAAAAHGAALEINSQIDRLDLGDTAARAARERGVRLVITSDAHSQTALSWVRWGVQVARRAWATPEDVLNTRSAADFKAALRRHRRAAAR
jgi:DNA polymerase (family 10)